MAIWILKHTTACYRCGEVLEAGTAARWHKHLGNYCRDQDACDRRHGVRYNRSQIVPKTGESEITNEWGRWLWCHDRSPHSTLPDGFYVHLDCDAIADRNGTCAACGGRSPSTIKEST
jgi:hypothetical protein